MDFIKYQGTNNFFAALVKEEEKYYFFFIKTSSLEINFENEEIYAMGSNGEKLFPIDKIEMYISLKAMPSLKGTLYHFIEIKESEFDSMYKLLECVYGND